MLVRQANSYLDSGGEPPVAAPAAHGSGLVTIARKSIRKLAQKVIPARVVTSSKLVIRQVLVPKSQEGVLALFL